MGFFQPVVIYRDPKEEKKNSILRYIGNRVLRKNANFLCGVTGQTGSGKSYACLRMAEDYSNMFNIKFEPECHIITSLKELLILINEPEHKRKIRFGSVIVFDEPQVEGNARNWQSDINQALSQLLSTFRNQRLVIFFALPFLSMFDKQSRILFHGEFRVEGYDKNTKITTIKPRFLEWNEEKQDFYRKMLIIKFIEEGKEVFSIAKLNKWHIPIASPHIIETYEKKKKRFTEELNKKLLKNLLLEERKLEVMNKSEELFKVAELYDKYGDDYLAILEEMPHLSPFTLDKYILYIKKSKGLLEKGS